MATIQPNGFEPVHLRRQGSQDFFSTPPEQMACGERTILFSPIYGIYKHMTLAPPEREWKKGSAELLVLSLLKDQPRHGYDISKLIQIRSGGLLRFHVTSLYPLLHRLEEQGSIEGRWVEKADQRRRRYYCLTPQGRKVLRSKQKSWKDFVAAISRLTGIEYA